MNISRVYLDNKNELIFRTHKESFSDKYGRNIYCDSICEVLLRTNEQLLCIGLCSSNTYTGLKEFVKYTPHCILFFKGNSIINSYCVERVFDVETRTSSVLSKEEILEQYDVELSENIKDCIAPKRHMKRKSSCML